MCSNSYYGVKDADINYSFSEVTWLSPNEVNYQLKNIIDPLDKDLIHPNELILNEANEIIDVLLLAKYRIKNGNIKLKSILLSQLNAQYCTESTSSYDSILILKLLKDSYFWCEAEVNCIPKNSLRVGYDQSTRQLSYIGRMKISSILPTSEQIPIQNIRRLNIKNVTNTITDLIGSLTHFYEYIPAIVLQLHDLSYLDEKKLVKLSQHVIPDSTTKSDQTKSFWQRLRSIVISNSSSKDMDFNFISNTYEVLVLKKQPITLKQKCINQLNQLNNIYFKLNLKEHYLNCFKLPNSLRNLMWPSILMPGQCIIKGSKMRSQNGVYEVSINKDGNLKLIKYLLETFPLSKKVVTYEKNLESLLISLTGVYLIFDSNQAMRKPLVLYKHTFKSFFDQNLITNNFFASNMTLELSDFGCLRVVVQNFFKNSSSVTKQYKSNTKIVKLIDINEFFKPIETTKKSINYPSKINQNFLDDQELRTEQSTSINLNLKTIFYDFYELPVKIFSVIMKVFNTLFRKNKRRLVETYNY